MKTTSSWKKSVLNFIANLHYHVLIIMVRMEKDTDVFNCSLNSSLFIPTYIMHCYNVFKMGMWDHEQGLMMIRKRKSYFCGLLTCRMGVLKLSLELKPSRGETPLNQSTCRDILILLFSWKSNAVSGKVNSVQLYHAITAHHGEDIIFRCISGIKINTTW